MFAMVLLEVEAQLVEKWHRSGHPVKVSESSILLLFLNSCVGEVCGCRAPPVVERNAWT